MPQGRSSLLLPARLATRTPSSHVSGPEVGWQILRRPVFRGRYSPSAFGIAGVGWAALCDRPGHADDPWIGARASQANRADLCNRADWGTSFKRFGEAGAHFAGVGLIRPHRRAATTVGRSGVHRFLPLAVTGIESRAGNRLPHVFHASSLPDPRPRGHTTAVRRRRSAPCERFGQSCSLCHQYGECFVMEQPCHARVARIQNR